MPSLMSSPSFSLHGKRALISGSSRGVGLAVAEGLALAGAVVTLTARHNDPLQAAANALSTAGHAAHAVVMDVTSVENIRSGIFDAVAKMGGLDLLINNAGVEEVSPSLDVEEALWDRIVDTNLKGAFFAAQAAAKAMGKGGSILNICSLTSKRGIATAVPYGSSKSGLLGMTRALAVEWASRGIRVNAVAPGYFRTALTEEFYENEDWQMAMLAKIPQARFGELGDLVGASVFLCSDASRYITGVCLPVDGGILAAL
jgi:NAD(P)-dependent dehydrogenase (short-subunit alcohol dehydrogenase family)